MNLYVRVTEIGPHEGQSAVYVTVEEIFLVEGPVFSIKLDPLVSPDTLKELKRFSEEGDISWGIRLRVYENLSAVYVESKKNKDRAIPLSPEIDNLFQRFPALEKLFDFVGHLGAGRAALAR